MLTTPLQAEALVRQVRDGRPREIFVDFEGKVAKKGNGLDVYDRSNFISGAAVKLPGQPASYLSFRHPESENLPVQALHDLWRAAVDNGVGISNHNLGFDAKMAHVHEGLPLPKGRDTWVAMQLENENRLGPGGTRKGAYALKYRAAKQFGDDAISAETELTEWMHAQGWDPKADLHRAPAEKVAPYACDDVNLVERMFTEWLDPRLEQLGILELADEYYEYANLITRMEVDGMTLDRDLVEQYLAEAERETARVQRVIAADAGREDFNPASPVQARTWTGLATTEAWRLKASKTPRANLLLQWRRWQKAVGTYYRPYLEWSDADGVLHPSYGFTRTGRLTCFDPNLHATPHYGPEYKMKDCWVAPDGFFLLYADWSQAEMRGCAHYTQDPHLTRAFTEGIDIHSLVAGMLGCDRQTAKPLNYGSAYGMGPAKLARQYGMTEADAKKWLNLYHTRLPGPRSLYRRMGALAEDKGWIRLWDGRYRRFSQNPNVRAFPHSASNSLLQGMVGAMSRRAMLRLRDWCYSQGGKMWIQIHDAIIFCLPLSMRNAETYRYVKHVMEDFPFRIKMIVDMGEGRTWREASENKLKFEKEAA
jgi:DNA polymerase I-like protein with 3'-5' exonuclease and polymerase domains